MLDIAMFFTDEMIEDFFEYMNKKELLHILSTHVQREKDTHQRAFEYEIATAHVHGITYPSPNDELFNHSLIYDLLEYMNEEDLINFSIKHNKGIIITNICYSGNNYVRGHDYDYGFVGKLNDAIIASDFNTIQFLVENSKVNDSMVSKAAYFGYIEAAKHLINLGFGRTTHFAIQNAVNTAQIELLKFMLTVKFASELDINNNLKILTYNTDIKNRNKMFDFLIEYKCEYDLMSFFVASNNLKAVELLINLGVNTNMHRNQDSPLFTAVRNSNIKIVETLLENKADRDQVGSFTGHRPIHVVSNLAILQLLIEYGADLNAKTPYNQSAFDIVTDPVLLTFMEEAEARRLNHRFKRAVFPNLRLNDVSEETDESDNTDESDDTDDSDD
jgi:hypothetical protein